MICLFEIFLNFWHFWNTLSSYLFPCEHGTPLLLERGDALGEVAGGVTLGLRRGLAQERGLQPRGLRLLPRAQRRDQRAHCDRASLTHLHVGICSIHYPLSLAQLILVLGMRTVYKLTLTWSAICRALVTAHSAVLATSPSCSASSAPTTRPVSRRSAPACLYRDQ